MDRLDVLIKNVKCLGAWQYSTDGIGTSFGKSVVSNSFFKQNDDTFTLYASNGVIEDSVIFKQTNGAVFQLSWGLPSTHSVKNVVVRRIDVVRTTPYVELGIRSVFNMAINEGCPFSNFLFEDIQIYDDVTTIFGINVESRKGA
jgi:hypothetical protein